MKNLPTFENFLNEGDMTNHYDGFIILDFKTKKEYKAKYIKGVNNTKAENAAFDKLSKITGEKTANFAVHGFVKKGEWNKNQTPEIEE